LVNWPKIGKSPIITLNYIKFKQLINQIKEIENIDSSYTLLRVEKINSHEYYELTKISKEILRVLINESPKSFKMHKKRKSGGKLHVIMVEQVKNKLIRDGWKIYCEEDSFHFKNTYVYFDIMAYKDTESRRIYRIFECETGADFEKQIIKNIKKTLKLQLYSGMRCNIVCLNAEINENIKKIIEKYFSTGERGLVQLITKKNFIDNKNWSSFGEEFKITNTSLEYKLIQNQVENKLSNFLTVEKKNGTLKGFFKVIDEKIKNALIISKDSYQKSIEDLLNTLAPLKIKAELYKEKIQEIKHYINLIKNENRIKLIGFFSVVAGNIKFFEETCEMEDFSVLSPLDSPINELDFYNFLNKHKDHANIVVEKLRYGAKRLKCKVILKNNLFIFDRWNHLVTNIPINIFIVVPRNMARSTIEMFKTYLNQLEKEVLVSRDKIEQKIAMTKIELQNIIYEPPNY